MVAAADESHAENEKRTDSFGSHECIASTGELHQM
jgi:hypothetical protein